MTDDHSPTSDRDNNVLSVRRNGSRGDLEQTVAEAAAASDRPLPTRILDVAAQRRLRNEAATTGPWPARFELQCAHCALRLPTRLHGDLHLCDRCAATRETDQTLMARALPDQLGDRPTIRPLERRQSA